MVDSCSCWCNVSCLLQLCALCFPFWAADLCWSASVLHLYLSVLSCFPCPFHVLVGKRGISVFRSWLSLETTTPCHASCMSICWHIRVYMTVYRSGWCVFWRPTDVSSSFRVYIDSASASCWSPPIPSCQHAHNSLYRSVNIKHWRSHVRVPHVCTSITIHHTFIINIKFVIFLMQIVECLLYNAS